MLTWVLHKLAPGKAPSKEFVDWCLREPEEATESYIAQDFLKEGGMEPGQWVERFLSAVNGALDSGKRVALIINQEFDKRADYTISGGQRRGQIGRLDIRRMTGARLVLENLCIKQLNIVLRPPNGVRLHIKDSAVAFLSVRSQDPSHPIETRLTIEDSNIGALQLGPHSVRHYEMRGGCILNIDCPPPEEQNPFLGSVSLLRVFLPRDTWSYLLKGPQPYRNLRAHLRSLENAQTANLVHAAEMAVERETDTTTNNFFSVLYELFSDFGSSALRPFLCWVGFLGLSIVVFYAFNGAEVTDPKLLVGWRCILAQQDQIGRSLRAAVMALQSTAAPLSIFGVRGLLVPTNTWLAFWSMIHGLFSITFIALFLLALRRRFKMQ